VDDVAERTDSLSEPPPQAATVSASSAATAETLNRFDAGIRPPFTLVRLPFGGFGASDVITATP
jgi:hypothetical protein